MSQLSIFDSPDAEYTLADLKAAWDEQVHTYNVFNADRKNNEKAGAYVRACRRYKEIEEALKQCRLNSH